jgi:ADP-heptose:LPS heptosyltransferase
MCKKVRRRLLIRPGAIGDFIVSLPAMEAVRADWTEVWCARQNVPLARFADTARPIPETGLDRLGFLPAEATVSRLREFDSIISWYGSNNEHFQKLALDELKLNITFLQALPTGRGNALEFYRRQALQLGANPAERYPRVPCPRIPRTFAVIHPFASGSKKQAPMALFRNAARRLANRMPVKWLRGPEDELPGATSFSNLYDLACWLAGARVYVGNDSGIAHLAVAVGTPVVALFSATDPAKWTPRGPAVSAIQLTRLNVAIVPAAG